MIEGLIWLAIGISIGWTASRMTDAEREAEAWGKHLGDEQTVVTFTSDPNAWGELYDWQDETSDRVDRDVIVRRPRRWNP